MRGRGFQRAAGEPWIQPTTGFSTAARRSDQRRRAAGVDKSLLATAPRGFRIRARDHVKSVAKEPCLVCGRRPADAHHPRFAQSPALGRKVSDEFSSSLPHQSPIYKMKPIATEPVEPRAKIKGNANRESTHRTQSPNDETYRLVEELAKLTGETLTGAVTQAVRERLDHVFCQPLLLGP